MLAVKNSLKLRNIRKILGCKKYLENRLKSENIIKKFCTSGKIPDWQEKKLLKLKNVRKKF